MACCSSRAALTRTGTTRPSGMGMPVVLVLTRSHRRSCRMPPSCSRTGTSTLVRSVAPPIVAALTKAVTGTPVLVSEESAAQFGAATLVRCVPTARVVRGLRSQDQDVAGRALGEGRRGRGPRRPRPVTVGLVAHDVVRRLSEMTGFGDAGVWGVRLAADLRAYRDGRAGVV